MKHLILSTLIACAICVSGLNIGISDAEDAPQSARVTAANQAYPNPDQAKGFSKE